MNPITHLLAGWTLSLPAELSRRDRGLIVLASLSPDIDAAPALLDLAQGHGLQSLELGSRYHHAAHNLAFAVGVSLACLALARRRPLTAALAFAAANLHYLCDIVGSRGPDGYQWPIPYLSPFSAFWQLSVPWQWGFNTWPNVLITAILLALTIYNAWRRGCSPVSLVSQSADEVFIRTLRGRFGVPEAPHVHR